MAYNSPGSPRLHNVPLRPAPFRSVSAQASPSVSPTNTTASRFHVAFESRPSRHAYHDSISSEISDDDGPGHALDARDSYLPNGTRMFDALQRELSLKEGLAALASPSESQDFDASPFAAPSAAAIAGGGGDGSDQLGTLRGLPRSRREYLNGSRAFRGPSQDDLVGLGEPGGSRPSTEGAEFSAPAATGPTIPPMSSGDSSNELSSSTDGPRSRERRAGERVFPAPLLLRSDRSYSPGGGGTPTASTSSVAYLPTTAPLSFQRRPSVSNVGADAAPLRDWTRRDASNSSGLSSSTRSALPYQSHRQHQSSTSSISYGSSLPYSTSPSYESRTQSSAIGLSISTSPVSYARSAVASITPPSSTLPTPSTTANAVPPWSAATSSHAPSGSAGSAPDAGAMTAQALLLHIHSLRSASSPMTLSRSLGPTSSTKGGLASHQRGRSAEDVGSGASLAADAMTPSVPISGPTERSLATSASSHALSRLDTVDLSHKRIAEVPIEVVDELKNEVEKLALGYNLLRDLPPHFAQFGNRLKYLNIRVNHLTTFPAVVRLFPESILTCKLLTLDGSALRDAFARDPRHQSKQDPQIASHAGHARPPQGLLDR